MVIENDDMYRCTEETKEGKEIEDSKYGKFDDYSVYFFDAETLTLYYIHNNI